MRKLEVALFGVVRSFGEENRLRNISIVVWIYVAIVLGTIAALGILTAVAPQAATPAAWIHAAIVAVLAVVLPLRARAARGGSIGALRAVGIIASVLFLVNVIEGLIPGLFPLWMRVQMAGVALTMAAVILLIVREGVARVERRRATS